MKAELRKQLKTKRLHLTEPILVELSNEITSKIETYFNFEEIDTIALYYPFQNEVNLLPLMKRLLDANKKVVLPKVLSKTTMDFYQINSIDDVKQSTFGVYEPLSNVVVNKKDIDIMFIPGLGFSPTCYRLGYGAGYYDRYLDETTIQTIGVCFDFQIVDFKVYDHDIPLSYVITENRLLQHHNAG